MNESRQHGQGGANSTTSLTKTGHTFGGWNANLTAPFSGTVFEINYDDSMGNYIILEADSKNAYGSSTKIRAVYMHMLEQASETNPALKKGASVTASTPIGKVGATGNVKGAHLHLAMITDGGTSVSAPEATNNPQMYYAGDKFTYAR